MVPLRLSRMITTRSFSLSLSVSRYEIRDRFPASQLSFVVCRDSESKNVDLMVIRILDRYDMYFDGGMDEQDWLCMYISVMTIPTGTYIRASTIGCMHTNTISRLFSHAMCIVRKSKPSTCSPTWRYHCPSSRPPLIDWQKRSRFGESVAC